MTKTLTIPQFVDANVLLTLFGYNKINNNGVHAMTKLLTFLFMTELPALFTKKPAPATKAEISAHRMMLATLGSDKKDAQDWVAH